MPSFEDLVRAIVREELAEAGTAPHMEYSQALLMSVPQAAKATGISVDTLRMWIADGRLPRRLRNAEPNPKHPVYLVSISEIRAVAEGRVLPARAR